MRSSQNTNIQCEREEENKTLGIQRSSKHSEQNKRLVREED